MLDSKATIKQSLSRLVGLPLAFARDIVNMKNFGFGTTGPHPSGKGAVGQYAMHVQCPWRIVGGDGIVTGFADYYEPAEAEGETDLKDGQAGNLQRIRLGDLLRSYDAGTRSWLNGTDQLVVEGVIVDDFGGFELELSGNYRLQVFPDGSRGEDWRFFEPGTEENHLVIAGGRISR
jgi:hypothetical protein